MASVDRGQASVWAVATASAIVSGLFGYYIGQARSIGLFGGVSARTSALHQQDDDSNISDAGSQSGDDLGELKDFPGYEECKLVLVVRTDLGMGKDGHTTIPPQICCKIAAQCSHATLACYKALLRTDPAHPLLVRWEKLGQAKVALKVDNEEELLMLQAQAMSLGLCAQIIHDAGRTQIASGSATVLGVGPAPKSKVDEVTGHLKLL